MLILTRRVNETLNIGDNIQVTVLGVKGNQVRIGINAPRDVAVHREEIYLRIKREENAKLGGGSVEQEVEEPQDSYSDSDFIDDSYGNR